MSSHNVHGSHTAENTLNLPALLLGTNFSAQQSVPVERKLGTLFAQKSASKEFFYGIELAAHSYGAPRVLDYNDFSSLLPLFTSIVWLGRDYWNVTPVADVAAVRLAHQLHKKTVVLPHFTCYRADEARVQEFLALNFSNVLVLSGDEIHNGQLFEHSTELVSYIKKARGDTISIGVGGYPERHFYTKSLEEDMRFLREKVDAGADFIITQNCYSAELIIQFVRNCRANGIAVPIIIGVYVPESLSSLLRMNQITNAQLPAEVLTKYKELSASSEKFNNFAVENAVQFLTQVLNSDLDVYGVQFFSLNRFKNIKRVLAAIITKINEIKR